MPRNDCTIHNGFQKSAFKPHFSFFITITGFHEPLEGELSTHSNLLNMWTYFLRMSKRVLQSCVVSMLFIGGTKREDIWVKVARMGLCRWKAKILVIAPSSLIPAQLPFCLHLKRGACSSVRISVCSSSEQGSWPCQSHYITRPRLCCLAWPGWRDNYRCFVFPAFPFFLPSATAPPPSQAGWILMVQRRSLCVGNRKSTVAWSATKCPNSKMNRWVLYNFRRGI